jgi:CDGSH-type Zn-finger protein
MHTHPLSVERGLPMSEKVEIKVRDNGSLRISGDFTIVDVDGNEIPHEGDNAGLCRCGHSANKPFCDGSHKERFESVVRAPQQG